MSGLLFLHTRVRSRFSWLFSPQSSLLVFHKDTNKAWTVSSVWIICNLLCQLLAWEFWKFVVKPSTCLELSKHFFFSFCRLDLARRSPAHRRGLWDLPTALPSAGCRGSHPFFWLSSWLHHTWEIFFNLPGSKKQPEKKTWVFEGPASRAHPPKTCYLVWRSTSCTFRCSSAGGYRQRFWKESRRLVWPLSSGTHTTVRTFILMKNNFIYTNKEVNICFLGLLSPEKQWQKHLLGRAWLCMWLRTAQVRISDIWGQDDTVGLHY